MLKTSMMILIALAISTPALADKKDYSERCQVFAGAMTSVNEGGVDSVLAAQKADIELKFKGNDVNTGDLPEVVLTDNRLRIDLSRDSIFGKNMRSKTIATGKISLRNSRAKPVKYELVEKGSGTAEVEKILVTRDNVAVKVRVQLVCTYTELK